MKTRIFLFSIMIASLFAQTAQAGTYIPTRYRVSNDPPGYCCWAALATLARAQGIASLYYLKEGRHKDDDGFIEKAEWNGNTWRVSKAFVPAYGGTIDSVLHKFDELGFYNYEYQRCGNFSKTLINKALAKGHGAVVQVNWQDEYGEGIHAIVLTDMNDDYVTFINSNGCNEERRSRQWFENCWDGFVVILE
jgi:hypothetical protein